MRICIKKHKNLKINDSVNDLTLLEITSKRAKDGNKIGMWECACGKIREFSNTAVNIGRIKSCGCRRKLPSGVSALKEIYQAYKYHAKERNLSFELSILEFEIIAKQNCYYCGGEPRERGRRQSNGKCIINGVDRKNNEIGYTLENCVPCCSVCNRNKGKMSSNQYIEHSKRIAQCHCSRDPSALL